jgi:hypothetical protein
MRSSIFWGLIFVAFAINEPVTRGNIIAIGFFGLAALAADIIDNKKK